MQPLFVETQLTYSMVGAGALVTKEVKNFSLVIGSPPNITNGSRNGVILDEDLICSETSEKYKLIDGGLELLNS